MRRKSWAHESCVHSRRFKWGSPSNPIYGSSGLLNVCTMFPPFLWLRTGGTHVDSYGYDSHGHGDIGLSWTWWTWARPLIFQKPPKSQPKSEVPYRFLSKAPLNHHWNWTGLNWLNCHFHMMSFRKKSLFETLFCQVPPGMGPLSGGLSPDWAKRFSGFHWRYWSLCSYIVIDGESVVYF